MSQTLEIICACAQTRTNPQSRLSSVHNYWNVTCFNNLPTPKSTRLCVCVCVSVCTRRTPRTCTHIAVRTVGAEHAVALEKILTHQVGHLLPRVPRFCPRRLLLRPRCLCLCSHASSHFFAQWGGRGNPSITSGVGAGSTQLSWKYPQNPNSSGGRERGKSLHKNREIELSSRW